MVKSGCNPRAMLPRTSRQKENEEVFLFSKQNIACNTNNSVTAIFFFFPLKTFQMFLNKRAQGQRVFCLFLEDDR